MDRLQITKPTAGNARDALRRAVVLYEITGKQRDRVYAYNTYRKVLAEDTAETG